MFTLPRLTARLAVVASFAALLAAACSPDSTGPSNSQSSSSSLLAHRKGGDGGGGGGGGGGAAAGFTVLGQAAVSCTDGSITGAVGTFQATPPGAITLVRCLAGSTHIGDAAAIAAFNVFLTQYDALAPQVGDCDLAHTLLSTIPASTSLSPGVYCTGAALTATDVTLTLDAAGNANATWLFKIGSSGPAGTGALTGTNFAVLLANGAQACNVNWWVSQAATINTTTTPGTVFQGNILAGAAITTTGGTLNGNAWAGAKADVTGVRVGDVTTTGTTVTGCANAGTGNGDGDEDDNDDGDHDGHGGKGHHHKDKCNQGVGNGPEGCDPGNSNHKHGSNDEDGGKPGHPGRKGGH